MGHRSIWIGAFVLAVVLAAATAVWKPQRPDEPSAAKAIPLADEGPRPAAPSSNPGSGGGSLAADLKALPPGIRAQVETALREAGAESVQIASLKPGSARGEGSLRFMFTPPAADSPAWHRETWDKYMAPLLYPDGHPQAGQWRDSVSPEDVQAAAMPLAERFYPADYLDQPMFHVPEKRIPFNELNQAASRLWDREDPATALPFKQWLESAPEDPNAYPSDFWLPAPAGHPEATSQREWIFEEIGRQAAEQMKEQRAPAGS